MKPRHQANMYFVVFLPPLRRNVLIPVEWIFDIENHLEKFINHGLNSNQWFLCYYTTNPHAFTDDQQPDKGYVPDFTLDLITNVNAGHEFDGVFFGNLIRFKRKYFFFKDKFKITFNYISYMVLTDELDGGIDFVGTHRNVRPPVYNLRRLREMPLPSLGIHANHLDQFYASGYFGDSSSEGENSAELDEFERAGSESETDADASNEFDNMHVNDDSLLAPSDINTNQLDNNVPGCSSEAVASVARSTNSQDQGNVENNDDSLSPRNQNSTNPGANNVSGGSSEADESVENGANALVQEPLENDNDATEPLIDQIANENIDEVDPLHDIEHGIQIKPELVPLYEMPTRNTAEMDELLDEPQTFYLSDDDGEMVVPETGLPKPFGSTPEGMVKRENDPITGNVPFNVEVSIL